MTTKAAQHTAASGRLKIHVAERGVRTLHGSVRCEIGNDVHFSTEGLESYFFARWEPIAYDALLLAAAVEFADVTKSRIANVWARDLDLRIPVHDPDWWSQPRVSDAIHDVLSFLTGDRWNIQFYLRKTPAPPAQQRVLALSPGVKAVIPFSNGLDSRVVAGLIARKIGDGLVRVRLGSIANDGEALSRDRHPFTVVPYNVRAKKSRRESSARSRGFKFALISGIAAYLANAEQIIVPESGQGSLGPMLVTVGQSYPDYRSHPLFTRRMEKFLHALLDRHLEYKFPQLWRTKGETLRQFIAESGDQSWSSTWSCWQLNRHVGVDHKKRQCGVCAACMLRRMSIHAAGLSEPADRYVWEDLAASSFAAGAAPSFDKKKITGRLREHAIAGTLHLDHLAGLLKSKANSHALSLAAFQLGRTLCITETDARAKLNRLLQQHTYEWESFVRSLGKQSFVAQWAVSVQQ